MGILHFLGLRDEHKNIFHNTDIKFSVSTLNKIDTDDARLVAKYLRDYKSQEMVRWETFERKFQWQIESARKDKPDNRRKRLNDRIQTLPEKIEIVSVMCHRNPDVVAEVLDRADGICERCLQDAPFMRANDGTPYLEIHHIIHLSNGGEDTVGNALALCPNCHREVHYGKKRLTRQVRLALWPIKCRRKICHK